MGLDMYLFRHVSVGAFCECRNVRGTIDITVDDEKLDIDLSKVSVVVERVGYWLRANQIHQWFVDHVQRGKDDYEAHGVDYEQLLELKELCEKILAEPNHRKRVALARKLLPVREGRLFDVSEYGECYFQDLAHTVKILSDLSPDGDYRYRAI
ncbi:MAG: hypothetical protein AB7F40_04425 [Victivallaceae bacterium]